MVACPEVDRYMHPTSPLHKPHLHVFFKNTQPHKQMSIMAEESAVASLCIGLSTPEMPLNTLVGSWKYSVGHCSTGQVGHKLSVDGLVCVVEWAGDDRSDPHTKPTPIHKYKYLHIHVPTHPHTLRTPHPDQQILVGSRWFGSTTKQYRFGCGCTVGVLVHIDECRSSESWDGACVCALGLRCGR